MLGFHPFSTQAFSSAIPFLDVQTTTNLIRLLTQQRNEAMDLNAKLQVELAMAKAELAEATKKDEETKEDK